MLGALATLLVFQTVGEVVALATSLPVPGPVLGMAAMLGWLALRPSAAAALRPTASELLRHLSLLFVPAGVGVMLHAQRLWSEGIAIAVALVVSTVAAIAVTALTVDRTRRWIERRDGRDSNDGGPDDASPGSPPGNGPGAGSGVAGQP